MDSVNHSLVYYIALKNAGVPVEMHLYAHGRHGRWSAAHQASDNGLASVGSDMAAHYRHDFREQLRPR